MSYTGRWWARSLGRWVIDESPDNRHCYIGMCRFFPFTEALMGVSIFLLRHLKMGQVLFKLAC
jgi:hypothetical protein